jgi:hypothetical protein
MFFYKNEIGIFYKNKIGILKYVIIKYKNMLLLIIKFHILILDSKNYL